MTVNLKKKPYRSIGDVARQFGISVEVLRKWENDFPHYLRPYRTKGATRRYTPDDVARVATVYHLLHDERLTIAGAQKRLAERSSQTERVQQVIIRLKDLRSQLLSLAHEIEEAQNHSA